MLTPTSRGRRDRKRLARVAVVAATITALSAGAAPAQEGAPGFEIKDELAEVKAEGPGFGTKLSPDGLRVEISDEPDVRRANRTPPLRTVGTLRIPHHPSRAETVQNPPA